MTSKQRTQKKYVELLTQDEKPYQLDPSLYKRFDQKNNLTVGRPNWDESIQTWTRRVDKTRLTQLSKDKPGYRLEDYNLFFAAGAVASRIGTSINESNTGLLNWTNLSDPAEKDMVFSDLPEDLKQWQGTPENATALVKRAAKFYGADIVGIAPLDPRWIFSQAFWSNGTHKEIVFKDVAEPAETETALIIPEKMKWVIVMGVGMDSDLLKLTPSPTGCAETQNTYSKLAMLTSRLAVFLRGIGYNAIPSMNDLGMTIPMAIDAGLGEQGRNGKLITPEFGPSVRLCKVITNLPLERDYPIKSGVKEFCAICKKCAQSCPAKAIPNGDPAWSGPTISNNPGVYTWHLNNDACRKYWALGPGTNCTVCINACPLSKKPGISTDLFRWAIAKIPKFNPIWLKAESLFSLQDNHTVHNFWKYLD